MMPQDTLVLKDKSSIPSLIIQVVGDSIRFKKISYISGPDNYILKSKLSYIRYQNGVKENTDSIFKAELDAERKQKEAALSETKAEVYKKSEMYLKGGEDARVNYYKPCGMAATGISPFFLNVVGIIPAIIISVVPPKTSILNYANNDLWRNVNNKAGYLHEAKRMKRRKLWKSFGIGMTLSSVFYFAISRVDVQYAR